MYFQSTLEERGKGVACYDFCFWNFVLQYFESFCQAVLCLALHWVALLCFGLLRFAMLCFVWHCFDFAQGP